jgi:hypothetical protein
MAWRTVQDDEEVLIGVALGEFIQEYLKTTLLHPRQVHTEALPARGFESRVQLSPLVSAFDVIRWTEPKRALASPMPVYKPESRLVESHNL